MDLTTGHIERVDGPVVHVAGLPRAVSHEFVEVGEARLPGEIIALDHERAVTQVYEYTGGLTVGEPVRASGRPLSVPFGPGLLGGIYDGLLRPLDRAGNFLPPRRLIRPPVSTHPFQPQVSIGQPLSEGDVVGTVGASADQGGGVPHLVMVPPGVEGTVASIADAGEIASTDVVATVGDTPIALTSEWPIRTPRPFESRLTERRPFLTGQRVLDVLEPIAIGSSATVIGGFGEGKTMLLEQIAKWGDPDIIIYVGCGERGNELADLIDELGSIVDPRTDHPLLERTIILANTSNMPVMAREASIYTAVTTAECYRDMGARVVIIADSTSRWAEARRELAGRTGAIPAEQGYPADLPGSLAAFYQRAGRVRTTGGREGAVTIITSVSPPGGDATEPVSAHTQRFVQAVWALDRDLAYARHYPAVNWTRSSSRDSDAIARWYAAQGDPEWAVRRARLHTLLTEADRLQGIAELVGLSALPTDERITLLASRLASDAILQQSALSDNDASCGPSKQRALAEAVLQVYDTARELGRAGTPAAVIEAFDLGPLLRAKDTVSPDDGDGVRRIAAELIGSMRELAP